MTWIRQRAALGLPALALLAACQTGANNAPQATAAAAQAVPANYRQLIAEYIKTTYFDPYSIRDATISGPNPGPSLFGTVISICVRANAKNRMGAYTGLSPTAYEFRNGTIAGTTPGAEGLCHGATYQPFPEVMAAR